MLYSIGNVVNFKAIKVYLILIHSTCSVNAHIDNLVIIIIDL